MVMYPAKETMRNIRAVTAGFAKFCPRPPKSCFTITMAMKLPSPAIQNGTVTGRLSARITPVTAALRSPMVCSRFMILRQKYSHTTADAVQMTISASALAPKNTIAATTAGAREASTSDIIFRVVISELRCGDGEMMSLSKLLYLRGVIL